MCVCVCVCVYVCVCVCVYVCVCVWYDHQLRVPQLGSCWNEEWDLVLSNDGEAYVIVLNYCSVCLVVIRNIRLSCWPC